ncbi:hypothetical protein HDU97_006084 [Phlyctochytrium planicorne]|nr:hypothetical protein HDU97_006084 [Phlyctochytrium planicorne]
MRMRPWALVLALTAALRVDAVDVPPPGPNSVKGAYLVELEGVYDCEAHVRNAFGEMDVREEEFVVRHVFSNKWFNGVSVFVDREGSEDVVLRIPGVTTVQRVDVVPESGVEELGGGVDGGIYQFDNIHVATGVRDAREKLGLTGLGVKVAVIDSGIYYTHPALGGGFGPGYKVAYGYDFVGDAFNGLNKPVPDSDPFENCTATSHGTHVSGVLAADATNVTVPGFESAIPLTGVAPNVTLGHYRVNGCSGGTTTDIVIAAIFMAAADGSDIINLSLGTGTDYRDTAVSLAVDKVSKDGVIVFAALGNRAASGLFSSSAPAVAEGGFGVASVDNGFSPSFKFVFEDRNYIYNLGTLNGSFAFETEYEVVVNNLDAEVLNVQDDGNAATPTVNATGKALLIRFGSTAVAGSTKRCGYAVKAGAVACILYSADPANVIGITGAAEIPSLHTTNEAGRAIIAAVKAGRTAKVVVSKKVFDAPVVPTGGTVSSTSSGGLDQDLYIKPDVAAVGGFVFSTISKYAQKVNAISTAYATISGTSEASPYAAGVAALILEAYKNEKLTFEAIRTLLQNTASLTKVLGTSVVESVAYQGAGLVNAYAALTTKTAVTPSSLSLNDTQFIRKFYEVTVTNFNTSVQDYVVTHQPARTVGIFVAPTTDDALLGKASQNYPAGGAKVQFGEGLTDLLSFSLKPGQSKTFKVVFTPPALLNYPVYSGYLVVSSFGAKVASVPYAGLAGSWKSVNVWSRNSPILYTGLFKTALANLLKTGGINFPPNFVFRTGAYFNSNNYTLINVPGVCVNMSSDAVFVAPIANTNSRNARVELVFKGNFQEANAWKAVGLDPKIPYILISSYSWNLQDASKLQGGYQLKYSPLTRNSYLPDWNPPIVHLWYGFVFANNKAVRVPKGSYVIRFVAQRHFVDLEPSVNNVNYDVVASSTFSIIY